MSSLIMSASVIIRYRALMLYYTPHHVYNQHHLSGGCKKEKRFWYGYETWNIANIIEGKLIYVTLDAIDINGNWI